MLKVGLVTLVSGCRCLRKPLVQWVLPLPKFPTNANTSPDCAWVANPEPRSIIASGEDAARPGFMEFWFVLPILHAHHRCKRKRGSLGGFDPCRQKARA